MSDTADREALFKAIKPHMTLAWSDESVSNLIVDPLFNQGFTRRLPFDDEVKDAINTVRQVKWELQGSVNGVFIPKDRMHAIHIILDALEGEN